MNSEKEIFFLNKNFNKKIFSVHYILKLIAVKD